MARVGIVDRVLTTPGAAESPDAHRAVLERVRDRAAALAAGERVDAADLGPWPASYSAALVAYVFHRSGTPMPTGEDLAAYVEQVRAGDPRTIPAAVPAYLRFTLDRLTGAGIEPSVIPDHLDRVVAADLAVLAHEMARTGVVVDDAALDELAAGSVGVAARLRVDEARMTGVAVAEEVARACVAAVVGPPGEQAEQALLDVARDALERISVDDASLEAFVNLAAGLGNVALLFLDDDDVEPVVEDLLAGDDFFAGFAARLHGDRAHDVVLEQARFLRLRPMPRDQHPYALASCFHFLLLGARLLRSEVPSTSRSWRYVLGSGVDQYLHAVRSAGVL